MLGHLSIQNYALIENVEIDFTKGLSIITGETGAGKSILLGALGLIAGQRADYEVIKKTADKCVVEGVFDIKNYHLHWFFEKNQLDFADQTILRREIKNNGLSRAFINDTPVNLTVLKELATYLIDIHSQHQNLLLSDTAFQLQVLDAFVGNADLLVSFKTKYKTFKTLKLEIAQLIEAEKTARAQQDFIQFQYDELANAELTVGELDLIERELATLENAEEIKIALRQANAAMSGDETNILQSLKSIKTQLMAVSKYNNDIQLQLERIESSYLELSDINNELEHLEEQIIYEPERINQLSQRLNTLNHLMQKHHVKTDEDLMHIRDKFEEQLTGFASIEVDIAEKEKALSKLMLDLDAVSAKLNAKRLSGIEKLQKEIMNVLSLLGMPQAQVKINMAELSDFSDNGKDKITFLFSGNKGGEFNEMAKVASGGEMSRIMLSIKSIMCGLKSLPTIIFDEIDTGVSGEIAYKLGTIMEEMGKNMQVFTITHLPQIACRGKEHFEVYKYIQENTTKSNIRLLNTQERISEIAKMLSGDKLTEAALLNAKNLLMLDKV